MKNSNIGVFSDGLSLDEVEFTKKCAAELSDKKQWREFLSNNQIKNALSVMPNSKRSPGKLFAVKSAMFEIRVAFLIQESGLNAKYECKASLKSNKTVDFEVSGDKLKNNILLIELTSLRESERQKNRTWKSGEFFGASLKADDEVDDEVLEYLKAQNRLARKAEKYPSQSNENSFNIIMLDMRSKILNSCDSFDFLNILYGSENLNSGVQRHMEDGKLFPGIFSSKHPKYNNADYTHLRKSIHYFGFVVEKNYTQDGLATEIQWYKNPELVEGNMLDLRKILNGSDIPRT